MTARPGWLVTTATVVPLAVLSAAWTVDLAGLPVGTTAHGSASPVVAKPAATALPDGTVVPSRPYAAPVSLSQPFRTTAAPSAAQARTIVANAVATGIPAPALAAYQRAATVIDSADPTCKIDWQLIAAIGDVESNHGRAEGNTLTPQGIATPGIFGPVLDGSNHVARIADTDGGQYDGNTQWDRAVGPLQFIPSTWAVVGVDADGDGQRNPQDINDASLAAAVYLCSGSEDLSTAAGQSAAVFRYNHSQSYVATVLGVAAAYRSGNFTTTPSTVLPIDFGNTSSLPTPATPGGAEGMRHQAASAVRGVGSPGQGGGAKNGPSAGAQPTGTLQQPGKQPNEQLTSAAASSTPSSTPSSSPPSTTPPSTTPPSTTPPSTTPPSTPSPTPSPTPTDPPSPAEPLATSTQLNDLCTTQVQATFPNPTEDTATQQAIDACAQALTDDKVTYSAAQAQVADLVLALPDAPYNVQGLGTPAPDTSTDN